MIKKYHAGLIQTAKKNLADLAKRWEALPESEGLSKEAEEITYSIGDANAVHDFLLNNAPDRVKAKADLSEVSIEDLAAELHKRDCVALVISGEDLADYWGCDEAGATSPATKYPGKKAWGRINRAFDRWLDGGVCTEAYEVMHDAWMESDAEDKRKK
jgi:hypothetical protein